jgi:hypothetical protein
MSSGSIATGAGLTSMGTTITIMWNLMNLPLQASHTPIREITTQEEVQIQINLKKSLDGQDSLRRMRTKKKLK